MKWRGLRRLMLHNSQICPEVSVKSILLFIDAFVLSFRHVYVYLQYHSKIKVCFQTNMTRWSNTEHTRTVLDHPKSYMAHMTLYCMTNMCGNLETNWSLIVCIAHIIVILVSSCDTLPYMIRSPYWFAGPKSAGLYFSDFMFSTKWNSYLRNVWHWSPRPKPTSSVLFTVWPLLSFAFTNYCRSIPSKLNASYWILVVANQNVPYVIPAPINYKIV